MIDCGSDDGRFVSLPGRPRARLSVLPSPTYVGTGARARTRLNELRRPCRHAAAQDTDAVRLAAWTARRPPLPRPPRAPARSRSADGRSSKRAPEQQPPPLPKPARPSPHPLLPPQQRSSKHRPPLQAPAAAARRTERCCVRPPHPPLAAATARTAPSTSWTEQWQQPRAAARLIQSPQRSPWSRWTRTWP